LIAETKEKISPSIASKSCCLQAATPSVLLQQGYEKLQKFIEIIDTDLADIQKYGTDKIKGAYFNSLGWFGQFVYR
jgi:hypothetical protein